LTLMSATASDGGRDDNKLGVCLAGDVVRLLWAKATDVTLRLTTSATANDLRNLGSEI
jgi:hypothetical protein